MAMQKQDFAWFELITTDLDAAERFYTGVVGWTSKNMGSATNRYVVMSMGDQFRGVGGMLRLNSEMSTAGAKPQWTGYLFAPDVDEATARAKAAGATVLREPAEIPFTARFSVISDPEGAPLHLFKPQPHGEVPPPLAPDAVGAVGWSELAALDLEKAWEFYASQFGWTKAEAYDMGPMGVYQTFSSNEQPMSGGMMAMPESLRATAGNRAVWTFYFNVEHIVAAKERVEAGGGTVTHGPAQVPGGGWILQGIDPQGAAFALLSRNG